MTRRRTPSLAVGIAFAVTLPFAAYFTAVWLQFALQAPSHTDFLEYWAGSRLAWAHGLSYPYRQAAFSAAISSLRHEPMGLHLYLYPPYYLVLIAPLAALPYPVAYLLMNAFGALALGASSWLLTPGGTLHRCLLIVASFGFFPAIFALIDGQATPLVILALALGYHLLDRHPRASGVFFALCLIKPQTTLFLGLALLAAGYRRAFASWLASAGVLAAFSLLALGRSGIQDYLANYRQLNALPFLHYYSIAWQLPPPWEALFQGSVLLVFALTLVARPRLERSIAIAVLAAMLVTPYMNQQELSMLLPVGLLLATSSSSIRIRILLAALWLPLTLINLLGPIPFWAIEIGGFVVIAQSAWRKWLQRRTVADSAHA